MADKLQILIDTSFAVNTEGLRATLSQIQKNTGIKINFDSSALNGVQTKLTEIKNNSGDVVKRISESVNAFGTITTKVEELNQKTGEWSTKVKEVTNTEKLLTEEIKRQQSIKAQQDAKDRTYWDAKRQHTIEQLTATSQESLAQRAYYSELEKTTAEQARLNEERKKANQFTSQKMAESFYNSVIEKTKQYKLGLMDLQTYIEKVQGQLYKNDGSYAPQFNNLEYKKQLEIVNNLSEAMKKQQAIAKETASINNQISATKKAENTEIQKKSYQELNKLLTEEYNIRQRIEEAKLKRHQAIGGSESEKQVVTVLEQELQEQLKINQAKRDSININLNNNGLVNQEKLNQLLEREKQLKSELVIKQNQIASAQKISTEKAEYDLKMFQQSMNLQADGLGRRYSYVGGASAEIEKYRQALQGVTAENGKWYISQRQADGTMQKTAVTAQQLRMQYRQMRNEIQGSISIFDTLRQNMQKFASWMLGGSIMMQGIRQIREMFSYTNEMNSYLTNVRIITNQTAEEVSGLTAEYISLGKALGATSTTVAQVAETFYRQGKTIEETKKLIEATTMVAQLSGLGSSEASEYMTSIMNGFKINVNDMENTVSKLVAVDNSAATSVSELSEALSKVSAVAYESGVSFDSLIGYIGTVSETTRQNAESIGKQNCRYVQKCA